MISFRFHVVSITVIFLAIAIGVLVGSTYVDGAIVDGLQHRIDTVERNLGDVRDENGRLEGELGRVEDFLGSSADFAVTDRLTDVPVLLVATRGVDEGAVDRLVVLARRAGATMPGIMWLEPSWGLESDDDRAALADIVGASVSDEVADLWATAWDAVIDELGSDEVAEPPAGGAGDGGTTTTTIADPSDAVLTQLEAAGFLTVDSLDDPSFGLGDLAGTDPRLLAVTGTQAEPEVAPLIPVVVEASLRGGLATVAADIYVAAPEGPARSEAIVALLSEEVRDAIILVDHADRAEGGVAAVLSLDAVATGQIGLHLGYGDGADGVLPAWTAP